MSDEATKQPSSVKCPICGAEAEAGCLYGPGMRAKLIWRAGPPTFWGNLVAGLFGESVGEWGLLRGPHVEGVRCKACKRIILES